MNTFVFDVRKTHPLLHIPKQVIWTILQQHLCKHQHCKELSFLAFDVSQLVVILINHVSSSTSEYANICV